MPEASESTAHDSGTQATSAGPSLFGGSVPIQAALNELRLRLLDLTGRNRLINFKHTAGKSLQLVHTSIDGALRRLLTDQTSKVSISPLPEPERGEWVLRNGRLGRPEPREYAVKVGVDPSYDLAQRSSRALAAAASGSQARTLFYAEDLGKHCRKLEREAKLAIEETGGNMLYLVLGFLEFPDSPSGDRRYLAPLVCVPVAMTRTDEGQYSAFHISHTGEEIADNLSLREKVKRDFGLNLPEYDADAEGSVETYFEALTEVVENLPDWRVRRMMTLTLLSFTNMLLVRDLDPESWPLAAGQSTLLCHPLVKQVFEGKPLSGEAQYATEYDIDEHPKANLPLIYDADSSQHSALIDVLEGKDRVIEGPPGTGKSQTITNLIAAALQAGKKVLFVAEKLAALQVVRSRLALAGLDPFVLELHSNKANKKRVLEDLNARVSFRAPDARDLPELLERAEHKRRELKAYAELMNSRAGNQLDLTLHQVMWRCELNRARCGEDAASIRSLEYAAATRTEPAQLAMLCDRMRYLSEQLEPIRTYSPNHALWGFFPTEFRPEDDLPVRRVLVDFADRFEAFAEATAAAARWLNGPDLSMTSAEVDKLILVLANVAPAESADIALHLLPNLFSAQDPQGTRSLTTLLRLSERAKSIASMHADVRKHLKHAAPATAGLVTAAKEALLGLKTRGLAGVDTQAMAARRLHLQGVVENARSALKTLRSYADLVAVEFTDTTSDLLRLTAVVEAVEAAPREHIHLQHLGLRGPGVVAKLEWAIATLAQHTQRHTALSNRLYMDALPPETDLSSAIRALREGDAWYRIFQSRWRGAIKLHKCLQQKKVGTSAGDRQRDLEQVRQLLRDQALWQSDAELAAASGPHFKGTTTPLAGLLVMAQWVHNADLKLEALEIPALPLDRAQVGSGHLKKLIGQLPAVRSALSALDAFEAACRADFVSALPSVSRQFADDDWRQRLAAARDAIAAMQCAEELMAAHVVHSSTAIAGLKAIVASHEVTLLEAQLAGDEEGLALFGPRFAGRNTDYESAQAAHTYGTLVKRAGLTSAIEQALLSPECVANHGLLTSYTNAINKGWQAVFDFEQAMSHFGRFDPDAWTNATGRSTFDYAQSLAAKTRGAAEQVSGLLAWAQYVGARAEATLSGLDGFVARLESGSVPPHHLVHAFLYRFYATVAQSAFDRSSVLRQFSGRKHAAIRKDFADLDKEVISLRGRQVAHTCRSQSKPPAGFGGARVEDKTEMELLRHLMALQRPRTPVRKMLQRAGNAIQQLKPCFMMGPQAVAQFLEPGRLHFDIIVMDEASQLRPEQAIGSIARGSQLVVVGDPKQLPPTSFFARMGAADGDGEDGQGPLVTTEAESILDVCISHFRPVRTLRWHYRSRHESLIAFSNHHFYRGNLVVFPSPYPKSKALGLRYQYVADGVYENQMNQVEARRVVDSVVDHILHRPDDSLGIVTLNIKQRDLVAEMLEERLRSLPEAAEFIERWEAEGMAPFTKNLENVQGDERDCILISTTFGKPVGAEVVRQNFGPISREGGWRRLNVLFTRARKSVAVFSSMRPEDIFVDAQTPEGTRALRNYLEYARTGAIPMERETDLPPDSDFEIAVMDVLRSKGYDVVPQLGVAGFRIDIAVKHPTHKSGYLAAIECDGASYHSGVSVRDRDRIRQEILEGLGWRNRIWRIWSTDWFCNPLSETERLLAFLEQLKREPVPQAYMVDQEPPAAPPSVASTTAQQASPLDLVLEDEDDDLEVAVGDLVSYAATSAPDQLLHVRLTARQTNPDLGLVAENTPLGLVLLGATIGDTVVLRVPGKPAQSFVVQGIKRETEAAA